MFWTSEWLQFLKKTPGPGCQLSVISFQSVTFICHLWRPATMKCEYQQDSLQSFLAKVSNVMKAYVWTFYFVYVENHTTFRKLELLPLSGEQHTQLGPL
jgi:hypothetical protein